MRTEGTNEGAGNEVGTSMERTMYPGSGLSVERIPLVLPECMMYMDGITRLVLELYCGGGRGGQPARLCLSYVVGESVCNLLTDPLHGGGPGGFIEESAGLQYG